MTATGLSAAALCARMAASHPRAIAFIEGERTCTFAELDARASALASALVAGGVRPGDRIALLMHNSIAMMELYFAAAKARAIALPINWRLAASEIAWIISDAAPSLILATEELHNLAVEFEREIPTFVISADKGLCFDALALTESPSLPEAAEDDIWIMLYTSGTTGRPKGCLLDQRGQVISALASAVKWRAKPGDSLLIALPLFHVGGLGILFAHYVAGASVVIAPRHFSASRALQMLHDRRCTRSAIPPQLYRAICEEQRERQLSLWLDLVSMGGGMHDTGEIAAVREHLGTDVLLGYGQTECGNFVSYLTAEEQMAHPRSCGRPLAHLDVQIVDDHGEPVQPGATGELIVRGPSTLRGYWHQPEATASAMRDGWVRTGDLFSVDDEGFLTLLGRSKELIKTGGENVYPKEVELALLTHPAIADCSVFGVPHEIWGEAVKAVVVLHPGAKLTREEVVGWCRMQIAGYKRPRFVEFLSSLPRSDAGKLLMRELCERPVEPESEVP